MHVGLTIYFYACIIIYIIIYIEQSPFLQLDVNHHTTKRTHLIFLLVTRVGIKFFGVIWRSLLWENQNPFIYTDSKAKV